MFLLGIAADAVLGLVNGALIAFGKVPSLVITFGTQQILYIPVLTLIAAVVLVAAGWYLRNLRGGRVHRIVGMYSMSSNERS